MKRHIGTLILPILFLSVGICSNCCIGNRHDFTKVYDSLKAKLPVVRGNNYVFSFDSLKKGDIWNWNKSEKVLAVDSAFYLKYLSKRPEFLYYKERQLLYFYCIIDSNENLKHIVILQKLNNDISDMYLVSFANEGIIRSAFLLARISKSPDDVFLIQSELLNKDSLKTTELHIAKEDDETSTKDSITSMFKYEKGSFNKVKVDTIRINNFKW